MEKAEQQKQHVDYFRKAALRKNLLEQVKLEGACYVPFCGDGDLAADLYLALKQPIYAADIDPARVATAKSRLEGHEVIQGDCDTFPFAGRDITYGLADFDSYSYPYASFRAWWKGSKINSPCVLFFTDGQRQAIQRTGHWTDPTGKKHHDKTLKEKRANAAIYFGRVIQPWLEEYIKPWTIKTVTKYLRGPNMLYWGAIIENFPSIPEMLPVKDEQTDKNKKVEDALFEAAVSGNIVAIQIWLSNRLPEKWGGHRNIEEDEPGTQELLKQIKKNLPESARKRLEKWKDKIHTREELSIVVRLIMETSQVKSDAE